MEKKYDTIAAKVKRSEDQEPTPAQPEKSPAPAETALKPITAEEQAIAARVAAESGKEWGTIGERSSIDYSLGKDMFELPPEALKAQLEKRFAFRWVTRTAARIDEMRTKRRPLTWGVCNAVSTPFLKKYIDPITGGICREDQILMYKPWWMHAEHRAMIDRLSNERSQDLTHLDGTSKADGASFVAAKRDYGSAKNPSRTEIGSDDIVFHEDTTVVEGESEDFD